MQPANSREVMVSLMSGMRMRALFSRRDLEHLSPQFPLSGDVLALGVTFVKNLSVEISENMPKIPRNKRYGFLFHFVDEFAEAIRKELVDRPLGGAANAMAIVEGFSIPLVDLLRRTVFEMRHGEIEAGLWSTLIGHDDELPSGDKMVESYSLLSTLWRGDGHDRGLAIAFAIMMHEKASFQKPKVSNWMRDIRFWNNIQGNSSIVEDPRVIQSLTYAQGIFIGLTVIAVIGQLHPIEVIICVVLSIISLLWSIVFRNFPKVREFGCNFNYVSVVFMMCLLASDVNYFKKNGGNSPSPSPSPSPLSPIPISSEA